MKKNIYGIVTPIATPFDSNEELDEAALRADVRFLIEKAGVHGIAVGGSTGEGHTLSTQELRNSVAAAIEEARGRVPVIAGIIVDSTRQAIETGKAVADLDVAALQITPVHYLFKPDDAMMQRHFAQVVEKVGLPVIIYNVVPWCYCSPSLLTKIITEIEGVIGVKQSGGDLKLLADLILSVGDRGVLMSAVDALLYPSFSLGADGAIAAIPTAVPALCVQLWEAVQSGDHVKALDLHRKLLIIWNAINGDNLPANVKYAMEIQGRKAGPPRSPMPASSEKQKTAIREALSQAGIQLVK
ncbi:MAG TPA: dihydrodipicolinate synthase family protein [Dehalococcoidia bacterium]|nr:dihydrodipicolinate synthase family protein [Dehalococcoidia bacterium]